MQDSLYAFSFRQANLGDDMTKGLHRLVEGGLDCQTGENGIHQLSRHLMRNCADEEIRILIIRAVGTSLAAVASD